VRDITGGVPSGLGAAFPGFSVLRIRKVGRMSYVGGGQVEDDGGGEGETGRRIFRSENDSRRENSYQDSA